MNLKTTEIDAKGFTDYLTECADRGVKRLMERRGVYDVESWKFDGTTGLLKFQLREGLELSYPAQIVGSWNSNSGTFLWSWANSSVPGSLSQASTAVRALGKERDWALLTESKLECDENMAVALVCAVGELTNLPIFYPAQASPDLKLYFVFTDSAEESRSSVAAQSIFEEKDYDKDETEVGDEEEVDIPADVLMFGKSIFSSVENVAIRSTEGSPAQQFARKNGFSFVAADERA